jgi:hypothetical protein
VKLKVYKLVEDNLMRGLSNYKMPICQRKILHFKSTLDNRISKERDNKFKN